MTREEQIDQMAEEYAEMMLGDEYQPYDGPYTDCITDVTYGAKWADENHKKELISIDKVCELLKKHINIPRFEDVKIEWIEQFRKVMEDNYETGR